MKFKSLILLMVLFLILTGCSVNKSEGIPEYKYNEVDSDLVDKSSSTLTSSSSSKLVYRATIEIQTQTFDDSCQKIDELVKEYAGFFESSNISNGSFYSSTNYRYGSFTVRIPTEKYPGFIDEVSKIAYVSNKSESTDNISQSYYEVETHIKSLKTEITRLQELMSKAENVSDLITIEKALTEVENELEKYQSTLSQYDSLVDYSTITISLKEVIQYKGNEQSFFEQIKSSFILGINGFVEFLEELVLNIVENIIPLGIIVALIILFKKKKVFARIKNKLLKRTTKENKTVE